MTHSGHSLHALESLHRLVWTAMFSATIAVGAYLHFPIGPIPFSMQPFFVFLAGYALGPAYGALSVALYLLAGIIGLPVFAGGNAGFAYLLGPTGGYLAAFVGSAALTGMAGRRNPIPWTHAVVWGAAALVVAYGLGTWRLAAVLNISMERAAMVGIAPFILPDAVKIVAAAACARHMQRRGLLRL
ncbi:biotin transporter BioY [Desulfobaculum sp. SPO524]|uniref:biotin transporter BioY n=1 Tax=Desulfobaculum sp. SPO524 TaxID=3378071 RepID=UPI003855641B